MVVKKKKEAKPLRELRYTVVFAEQEDNVYVDKCLK
jgi:hypothetical protein